ncbi:MAG TPA: sulfite exporter TauE/SafE family protein, partial [Bryobacterales bacterium]|nr:sulfite exporter TauE/SafE family protein [Bryobacterales bacterium]
MSIYLPIAEISVNLYLLLGLGGVVGFLSGMFGVGGGFLMTPMLMMIGIPPAVAVATEANQIVASSVSGAIAQYRRGNVDVKMGVILLVGGIIGSVIGVQIVKLLREIGQVDLVIKLTFVTMLSIIGTMMFFESLNAIRRSKKAGGKPAPTRRPGSHTWVHGLPFRMRFPRSKLYISVVPPIGVGVLVGLLAAVMGVGGGFIMVPAMIYLLRMPTGVVVGTSLFQIGVVTINTTILNAVQNQTVDVVLALILMASAVIGAQIGARVGSRMP